MAKQILLTDNGVHREAKEGYMTVNGVYRKIKEGFVTVNGVYRSFMSSGLPFSDLPVGTLIKTNVNGVGTNFMIVHQGLPSSLYDSSCDGTWLLMKDIYEARQWHNSKRNSYKESTIHTYLNGAFLNLFDADIKAQIKTVKIPYVNGTGNNPVASGSSGLSVQIFLLSGYEVGWTQSTSRYFPIDGACLSYFSGTAERDSKRIAYLNGTATRWWLRSTHTNFHENIMHVMANGDYFHHVVTNSNGVRPAFILPSNAVVNPTPNADGSYTLLA